MEFVINTQENGISPPSMHKTGKGKNSRPSHEKQTNSPIKRNNQASRNFKGPRNEPNQTFWDLVEYAKVHGNPRCRYSRCNRFPCNYKHEVKDYDDVVGIAKFKNLLQDGSFEDLCKYHLGIEDTIKYLRRTINWKTNNSIQTIADFLRFVDRRFDLLEWCPLPIDIDCDENNKEQMKKNQLRMISFIMARFYILYFREEVVIYSVLFENAAKNCLQFMLQDKILDEVTLSLIFHLSRGFVDSNPSAFECALTSLQNINSVQIVRDQTALEIIHQAQELFHKEIIPTKGFEKGLMKFLEGSVEVQDAQNFSKALKIIKSLKVELVDGVQFNGMCGHNRIIYIAPKQAFYSLTKKEAKVAPALVILLHESAHHLIRCFGESFDVVTPRDSPDGLELEAGYRFEHLLVGELYKFKYWEASAAFLKPANWVEIPINFSKEDLKRIEEHSREIRNPSQSGIEDGQHLTLEI